MSGVLASGTLLLLLSLMICSHGFLTSEPRHQHATARGDDDVYTRQQGFRKSIMYTAKTDTSEQQDWNDATVLSTEDACPSGKSLLWRVQVSPKLFDSYQIPGQFVQLRIDDKDPLFLAMCSAPGKEENVFEFLVKTTPNIPWLPSVKSGMTVQLTKIMGSGFDLDQIVDEDNHNIIMCVAGSGIAPIKACIESGRVTSGRLYYGEWTDKDLCFTAAYREWGENIKVISCLSRDSDGRYRSGYVQDVLQEDGISSSCSAILCGMPEMEQSVRTILLRAGMSEINIFTNLQ